MTEDDTEEHTRTEEQMPKELPHPDVSDVFFNACDVLCVACFLFFSGCEGGSGVSKNSLVVQTHRCYSLCKPR